MPPAGAAVGGIVDGVTASELLNNGSADAVFMGRALLRDTSWANNAAAVLGARGGYLLQCGYAV
ncbi:hypothetical protein [Arthrobacter sp. HLT1-20]